MTEEDLSFANLEKSSFTLPGFCSATWIYHVGGTGVAEASLCLLFVMFLCAPVSRDDVEGLLLMEEEGHSDLISFQPTDSDIPSFLEDCNRVRSPFLTHFVLLSSQQCNSISEGIPFSRKLIDWFTSWSFSSHLQLHSSLEKLISVHLGPLPMCWAGMGNIPTFHANRRNFLPHPWAVLGADQQSGCGTCSSCLTERRHSQQRIQKYQRKTS